MHCCLWRLGSTVTSLVVCLEMVTIDDQWLTANGQRLRLMLAKDHDEALVCVATRSSKVHGPIAPDVGVGGAPTQPDNSLYVVLMATDR